MSPSGCWLSDFTSPIEFPAHTLLGSSEDVFIVYEGHSTGSLELQAPVWRYSNKNALHSPNVPAVDKFRKLIHEAEKQQKTRP